MTSKILAYSLSLLLFTSTAAMATPLTVEGSQAEIVNIETSANSFSKGKKKKNGRYKKKKRGLFKRLFKKSDCDCPKH